MRTKPSALVPSAVVATFALLVAVIKESGDSTEAFINLVEELRGEEIFREALLETDTDIEQLELRLNIVLMGHPVLESEQAAGEGATTDAEILPDADAQVFNNGSDSKTLFSQLL